MVHVLPVTCDKAVTDMVDQNMFIIFGYLALVLSVAALMVVLFKSLPLL